MTRTRTIVWIAAVLLGGGLLAFSYFSVASSYSNIYPKDYVGPAACGKCHADNYELWQTHAHRTMNQTASEETVRGDFSGPRIDYAQGHAIFERDGEDFVMSIYEQDKLIRRHKVTRTIGSLYMQYYIGTQIEGPEPAGDPTYTRENKLPFGYSLALGRWLPEIYLDSTLAPEREFLAGLYPDYIYGMPPSHSWNLSCMTCHNTYPYVNRLQKQKSHDPGFAPRSGFPAAAIDWRGEPFLQSGLKLAEDIVAIDAQELVTVGISCESCHFGGREHAEEGRAIRFVPTAPKLTVRHPETGDLVVSDRKDPFVVNSICNQCHCAQLNVYANDTPAVNSNEVGEMMGGACSSEIKCTDCHNPHRRGQASGSAIQTRHTTACLKCHQHLVDPTVAAQHSRHSNQVSCLDCHMPRIIAGLDTVTRTHRIALPVDKRMVEQGQPNACNLCHLDRTIQWTVEELERGWGEKAPAQAQLELWYGPALETPMGEIWLHYPNNFVRLAAVEAYARSPFIEDPVPFILDSLSDEYAFNRTFGLIALEKHLERRISRSEYDLLPGPVPWKEQVANLAASLRTTAAATGPR